LYKENQSFLWGFLAVVAVLFVIRRLTKPDPARQSDTIHQHQSHHFENFQMSSQDFYADLKEIIEDRQFPRVKVDTTVFTTGGIFDPKREYLKISSGDHIFYVCAAPFGRNFFVSYWLRETEEDGVDWLLRKVFGVTMRKTFFQIDTEAMFMESIKKAVLRAIERATEERGVRQLAPGELTPLILS
jgi:peptidyl-tRNA hydrolase